MRTKTLLLTAALGMASVASSMAQVYSANAVGYVNMTLGPGFSMISNPLNGTNNHLNTILQLPDVADGTLIYRFDPAIQNYGPPIQYFGGGFGWAAGDGAPPNWLIVNPGEGLFIEPVPGSTPLNITFVGEVPQGNLSHVVPAGFSIQSSEVPQALPLGDTTINAANSLMFPAADGDFVYVFSNAEQAYLGPYQYIESYGWAAPLESGDDVGPAGPVIAVATSFFVEKAGAAAAWSRQFTVN